MYVRWKKGKQRVPKRKSGRDLHVYRYGDLPYPTPYVATLVESRRIDGKPRQKHIAYIGTVEDVDLDPANRDRDFTAYRRWKFWLNADFELSKHDLTPEQRATAEATLSARVPRPNADDEAAAENAAKRLWGKDYFPWLKENYQPLSDDERAERQAKHSESSQQAADRGPEQ